MPKVLRNLISIKHKFMILFLKKGMENLKRVSIKQDINFLDSSEIQIFL